MAATLSRQKLLREWKLYFFIVPSLVMVLVFAYFPAGSAIYHSFFEWAGGDTKQLIGFDNFRRAFHDEVLLKSFITVSALMVFALIQMGPSILLAVLIHRLKSDRWQYIYRVLLVVPMIVPGLVRLFIWKFFFDPNLGVLNGLLDFTGLKSVLVSLDHFFHWGVFYANVPIGWLSQPELILPSLFLWGFPWIGAVGVLIFLAGLQSIGQDVYEAAELDGIGPIGKFIYIELPLILTQIRLMLVLLIVATLGGYGLQLQLLNEYGGPGGRGMVPGLWMYNRAFYAGEFGYACAIGMLIFVFILVLTFLNNRYVRVEKMSLAPARISNLRKDWGKHLVILFFILIELFPLYMMFQVSFKDNATFIRQPWLPSNPLTWHWENWNFAFHLILPYIANTVFVAVTGTVVSLFLAILGAYFFARHKMPFSGLLWAAFLALMLMPSVVNITPLFMLLKSLKLLNTLWALVFIGVAGGQVFSIFVLRNFIEDLPRDLFEAAEMDGASHLQQVFNVVIPMSGPIIGTLAILSFLGMWNDFLMPLIVLRDKELFTLGVGLIYLDGEYVKQWGQIMAAYFLASIPLIIVFLFTMRLFVRGLSAGAIKG